MSDDMTACECIGWARTDLGSIGHHPACGGPHTRAVYALRALVKAVEYEAAQGDGISEEMAPAYDAAKAEVARLTALCALPVEVTRG